MNPSLVSKFTRRVAFGIPGDQALPSNPLEWAFHQLDTVPPIDIIEGDGARRQDLPPNMRLLWKMSEVMHAFENHQRAERVSFNQGKQMSQESFADLREKTVFTPYNRLEHWMEVQARATTALFGQAPVFERFWHFWTNHFMVAPGNQNNDTLVGPYQRSLRGFMTGNFKDMLWHAVTHPGMLIYLDNNRNTGPNSIAAKRKWTKDSVNENLGRELLELFTVSPNAAYSQKDVESVTLILTGWREMKPDKQHKGEPLGTYFDFNRHEPGAQEVMGKRYSAILKPASKLEDLIADLALHPATAEHIAKKLCIYFIDDEPPTDAINSVKTAFVTSQGHLPTVHRAVVQACWKHLDSTRKFASPETWFLQVLNTSGSEPPRAIPLHKNTPGQKTPNLLSDLGQALPRCPQPNGWPIRSVDWLSKEMLDRRLRVLPVLVDVPRQAGRAVDAQKKINAGAKRDLQNDLAALALFERAAAQNDTALSMIAYFTSSTMLWS